MSYKTETFKKVLNMIQTDRIRNFLADCLENVPDYFFEVPAANSSKHHPRYALGKGGLVRHTKATVMVLDQMLRLEVYSEFDDIIKDLMIVALTLHDSHKCGNGPDAETRMVREHPILASVFVGNRNFAVTTLGIEVGKTEAEIDCLTIDECNLVMNFIERHMGRWNCDRHNNAILPKPETLAENLVHLCDYIASRNFLEVPMEYFD